MHISIYMLIYTCIHIYTCLSTHVEARGQLAPSTAWAWGWELKVIRLMASVFIYLLREPSCWHFTTVLTAPNVVFS